MKVDEFANRLEDIAKELKAEGRWTGTTEYMDLDDACYCDMTGIRWWKDLVRETQFEIGPIYREGIE